MKSPGQSLTEYTMVMALVVVVLITGLRLFGRDLNRALEAMLPASNTASPVVASVVSSSKDNAPMDTAGTLPNTTDSDGQAPIEAINKTPQQSKTDKLLEKYRSITQTAGSLGVSQQVLANSDELVSRAMKYKESDPVLFNVIVQMGIQGKQLAKEITAFETNRTDANKQAVYHSGEIFFTWIDAVGHSDVLQRLSAEDQALVIALGGSNFKTASNIAHSTPSSNGADNSASKSVDSNSNQIITCGEKLNCNK